MYTAGHARGLAGFGSASGLALVSGLDSGALAHGVVFSVPHDSSKNNPISAWLSNISSAERADTGRQ